MVCVNEVFMWLHAYHLHAYVPCAMWVQAYMILFVWKWHVCFSACCYCCRILSLTVLGRAGAIMIRWLTRVWVCEVLRGQQLCMILLFLFFLKCKWKVKSWINSFMWNTWCVLDKQYMRGKVGIVGLIWVLELNLFWWFCASNSWGLVDKGNIEGWSTFGVLSMNDRSMHSVINVICKFD